MDSLFHLVNLRSLFFFTSGFMDFAFLLFLLNWIVRIIKKGDR